MCYATKYFWISCFHLNIIIIRLSKTQRHCANRSGHTHSLRGAVGVTPSHCWIPSLKRIYFGDGNNGNNERTVHARYHTVQRCAGRVAHVFKTRLEICSCTVRFLMTCDSSFCEASATAAFWFVCFRWTGGGTTDFLCAVVFCLCLIKWHMPLWIALVYVVLLGICCLDENCSIIYKVINAERNFAAEPNLKYACFLKLNKNHKSFLGIAFGILFSELSEVLPYLELATSCLSNFNFFVVV